MPVDVVREAGPSQGEVLQRKPQRLRVGELALEVVERGLQRRKLVVVELETVEEVVLRAQRVELLAGELVALRVERHAERRELGAIGVEAPRERLVGHLRVALDVRLHVPRGQRPALCHEEGDERELPDQLVGVVRHVPASLSAAGRAGLDQPGAASAVRPRRVLGRMSGPATALAAVRSRCWCDGQ